MRRLALALFFIVALATALILNRRASKSPAAPPPVIAKSPAPSPPSPISVASIPPSTPATDTTPPPLHAPAPSPRIASAPTSQPPPFRDAHPTRDTLLSGEMVLTAALTRAGHENAAAAAETFLWGLANNDTSTLEALIVWTWRDSAWAQFRNVPQPYLMQAGSPDRLLAWALINDFATVGGVQLVQHRIFGPNDEEFRFRFHHAEGKTTDESFLMRRIDGRWKREQWPTTIGNIAARLRSEKKPFIGR